MTTGILEPLILASSSPRRAELLHEAGYRFEVIEPSEGAECGVCSRETPAEFAARMAFQKGSDVARRVSHGLVLACDTVAECQGTLLGKPVNRRHAQEMLELLSGRRHRVYSAVGLWPRPTGEPMLRIATSVLQMDRLSAERIEEYLESGLWEGKAGAFGYQDRQGWLHLESGSESNVVGLPLELLAEMLIELRTRQTSP